MSSQSPTTPAAAPAAPAAPAYTPSGAAASERMLSSVLGRVVGGFGAPIGRSLRFADRLVGGIVDGAAPKPGRGLAQRLFAPAVFGPPDAPGTGPPERLPSAEAKSAPLTSRRERGAPTQDLLTTAPGPRRGADLKLPRSLRPIMALSSPERMFGSGSKSATETPTDAGADDPHERPAQPVLATGWEPPVAHAALETSRSPEAASPLWGAMPRPTLEPLIAAVEADLGRMEPAAQPAQSERRDSPSMALLQGGSAARRSASSLTEAQAHQLAMESSKRLMDAVRAHAAANGSSDDRISLGDMTLIAFADSNKRMAAAESYTSNAPDPQPTEKALGQLAHPKIKENQGDLHNKLRAMAKLVAEDLKQVQKLSKERFGAHG